ncbi:MAG: TetR/AcrR family transcriptional regulator, partial [Acholeplasmataceae bacterium]|nr:TetR/AcrR family transcriptional regulator [Acholeplasmataceae bacterium]
MKPTDIQKHIIEVTRELLKKNPDVTIKKIADASYVNIASVNYYFGSKNQLFKIVCEGFVEELKNVLLKLMLEREEGQTEVLLKKIISFLYDEIMENAGIMNYILQNLGNEQGDMLLKTFFSENEFTEKMFELFKKQTD